ncbi:hypothetical protein HDU97_009914, partial [Phlyctochytrium planicorne]
CIIITSALLLVSTTSTANSNNICVQSGLDGISTLVNDIQSRTSELVAERFLAIVKEPIDTIIDTDRISGLGLLDVTSYDRLLPYFRMQLLSSEAISLAYYGDIEYKDFIGVRRLFSAPDVNPINDLGYDLMDGA